MKIKLLLLLLAIGLTAQAQTWLWPIDGHKANDNVLYVPQQHINGELNLDELFIGGEEDAQILSPENATVSSFSLTYLQSLSYPTTFSIDGKFSIEDNLKNVKAELDTKRFDPDYLTGSISLRLDDGRKYTSPASSLNDTSKQENKYNEGRHSEHCTAATAK